MVSVETSDSSTKAEKKFRGVKVRLYDVHANTPYSEWDCPYEQFSSFVASDRLDNGGYLGYRWLINNLLTELEGKPAFVLSDVVRKGLQAAEPPRKPTLEKIKTEVEDNIGKPIIAFAEDFDKGLLSEEEAASKIMDAFKYPVSAFDEMSPYSQCALALAPKALPLLIVAIFLSEFSRNRATFTINKMLLDLLDMGMKMSCDDMNVDWKSVFVHPELELQGSCKAADPHETLLKLGGLHSMTHKGSFNEFGEDPYKLDPEKLSWAQIKSTAILLEWVSRRLGDLKYSCKILNKSELDNARIELSKKPPHPDYERMRKKISALFDELNTDLMHECKLDIQKGNLPVLEMTGFTLELPNGKTIKIPLAPNQTSFWHQINQNFLPKAKGALVNCRIRPNSNLSLLLNSSITYNLGSNWRKVHSCNNRSWSW